VQGDVHDDKPGCSCFDNISLIRSQARNNGQLLSGILSYGIWQIGIQNGPPDGLALVDNTNKVVQFLSYEGTFTAADGPANGMTSTDIRVSQTGTTSGDSLQLTGTGRVYEDFTWADTAPATPGTVNTGQVFPKVASSAHSSLQGIRFLLLK
jgi:hypothetical protein